MITHNRGLTLTVTLTALTVANAVHAIRSTRQSLITVVSTLSVGDTLHAFDADLHLADSMHHVLWPAEQKRCQLLVAFSSSCPFCKQAALREKTNESISMLPVTWVGNSLDLGIRSFVQSVRPSTTVVESDSAWTMMGIKAVPTAVLTDKAGVVRRVFTYRGDESGYGLLRECRGADRAA